MHFSASISIPMAHRHRPIMYNAFLAITLSLGYHAADSAASRRRAHFASGLNISISAIASITGIDEYARLMHLFA